MSDVTAPTEFETPVTRRPAANPSAPLVLSDETATAKVVVVGDGASEMGVSFGTSRADGDVLVTGSRPDEVTLIGPLESAASMIGSAPTGGHTTVVDWTHRSAMFRLTGDSATKTLAKLCHLDFADAMVPDGAVVSSSVAGVSVDLVRNDRAGSPSFLMACDRSFGQYLFDTLLEAGQEFHVGVA